MQTLATYIFFLPMDRGKSPLVRLPKLSFSSHLYFFFSVKYFSGMFEVK